MLRPTRFNVLAAAVIAASLCAFAGCSNDDADDTSNTAATDKPAAATSQPVALADTLRPEALMDMVFAGWEDADGRRGGNVTLPDIGSDGRPAAGSAAARKADVSPREVVRLDDTHAVLLTEAVPLDAQEQRMDAHVNGAWLGAYFFQRGDDGWAPSKREDAVDYLGFMGSLGDTQVERIAPHRFVLSTTSGSCWQGYCGSWLSVFAVGTDAVRPLAGGIPLSADNSGADGACEGVLKYERPDPAPQGACFNVEGTPEFTLGTDAAPGDMRIAFAGARTASAGGDVQSLDTTLVYNWRRGAYVLVDGNNPVPSF